MAGHTPGPWRFNGGTSSSGIVFETQRVEAERCEIAAVFCEAMRGPNGDGEGNANARLIAAAPDLLYALVTTQSILERCMSKVTGADLNDMQAAYAQARAALAKAKDG